MIIDTHTHFGDPSRPIEALYRTELPEVYKAVAKPHGVTGTVHVEARGDLEENQWILDLASEDPFFVGMVGRIDPYSAEFGRHLERFAASPFFRGIRVHGLDSGGVQNDPYFLKSMEALADHDLSLDVHHSYEEYDDVFVLARRLPELRLVLNHIGEGRTISGGPPDPLWIETMKRIAELPQVYCKVSALVQMTETVPAPVDVEFYTPVLDVLWDAFGEDRLVFASNWPQIERVSDFASAFGIVDAYFGAKGEAAREKFFWRNSRAAYKWADRT